MDDRYEIEHDFFGEERKKIKQERKRLSEKDRSKYKKTDKEKWLKSVKKIELTEDALLGRVLSISPQGATVDFNGKLYLCNLRGLLKKEAQQEKNLMTVGDFVHFIPRDQDEGSIIAVAPRKSILARADNLSRRKQQLIAANIDQVLITLSVGMPALKPFLADRYIIAAEKGGMQPIIVINKIDQLKSDEERELVKAFIQAYGAISIPVILTSVITSEGIESLKEIMKDKASVFSGQSGVGKSSLINRMTGLDLKVGEPVEKTGKGSHTTTKTELIPLAFGGFCIDTPGIRSFGIWDLTREEIESYFHEIHEIGADCKFPDCFHIHETGCAVKKAVDEGGLSPLRYNSYLNLITGSEEEHLRR